MTTEVLKLATDLRDQIGEARNYTQATDAYTIFMDAENIIGTLSFLVGPVMELETLYRQKVVEFMEKGDSAAKAEAKAKATEEYKSWRKLQMIMDLGTEQIMLCKRFKESIEMEYNRIKR